MDHGLSIGAALMLVTGPAAAETAVHEDRLTLPAGRALATGVMAVNLSTGVKVASVSLSPDLWYGVVDRITVGLVFSGRGRTGLLGELGASLCVTGKAHGCAAVFQDIGGAVRADVIRGTTVVAVEAGGFASDVGTARVTGKLGVVVRWHHRWLAVEAAPAFFAVTSDHSGERFEDPAGDVDYATAHVTVSAAGRRFAMALQAGAKVPFVAADDDMTVPVSLGFRYALREGLSIDGAFSMASVTGGENAERGWEPKVLSVGGAYAF